MIKTKSILNPKDQTDGTRICVMRWVKDFYDYDEWIIDLSPSTLILNAYRNYDISWKKFEIGYVREIIYNKDKMKIVKGLKCRSDNGEIITLLCWEKFDKYCHRRLLKGIIDGTYDYKSPTMSQMR